MLIINVIIYSAGMIRPAAAKAAAVTTCQQVADLTTAPSPGTSTSSVATNPLL
jgi:hypothetical protein